MRKFLIIPLLLLATSSVLAETPFTTAEEVISAVQERPEPTTMQATLTMVITSANGQSLTRELSMWSSGEDQRVIKFTAPADIAGSGFLSLDKPDGSSENLIYLPALDRVRRVAGASQGDSFFGSDFSYDDINGIDPDDYTHTLLEVLDGPAYLVEAIPLAGSEFTYDRLLLEIPHTTLVPERVEYYRDGTLIKTLTTGGVTTIGDYVIASERRMDNASSGGHTIINQDDLVLDEPIPTEVFSERFLRR